MNTPQLTDRCKWWKASNGGETVFFPADDYTAEELARDGYTVEPYEGIGARFDSPTGPTEWVVFEDHRAARDFLDAEMCEEFGIHPDDLLDGPPDEYEHEAYLERIMEEGLCD